MEIKYKRIIALLLVTLIMIVSIVIIFKDINTDIDNNEVQCQFRVCDMDFYSLDCKYDKETKTCKCFNSAGVKTSETKMI